jgi:hypothetical protein
MTHDVKKQVCAKRQALRVRIENYEITKNLLPKLEFKGREHVTRNIERAQAELDMLETRWKF